MSPTQHKPDPLDTLLGDVLSNREVSPEQLVQYAERPDSLNADERAHIEACLAESPQLRDELKVLQQFAVQRSADPAPAADPRPGFLQRLVDSLDEMFGRMLIPAGAMAVIALSVAVVVMFEEDAGQPEGLVEQQPEQTQPVVEQPEITPEIPEQIEQPPQQIAQTEQPETTPAEEAPLVPQQAPEPAPPEQHMMLAMIEPVYVSPYNEMAQPVVRGEQQALRVLAPAIANTANSQPTLYWQLDQVSRKALILFELSDETTGELVISKSLDSPDQPGRQAIHLKQLGVELIPGTEYQWSIVLQMDVNNPALDRFASAKIKYVKADAALKAKIAAAKPGEVASIYAGNGYWYDALDGIVRLLEEYPGNEDVVRGYRGMIERVLTAN